MMKYHVVCMPFYVTLECALCAPLALLPPLTSVLLNTGSFKGSNSQLSYLFIDLFIFVLIQKSLIECLIFLKHYSIL